MHRPRTVRHSLFPGLDSDGRFAPQCLLPAALPMIPVLAIEIPVKAPSGC